MTDKKFYGYLQLARQQLAQHNPQLALETLKEAAKLEPNHAILHQLLAIANFNYFQQNKKRQHYKAAKENIETSLRLAPDNAHSFYVKSLILQYSRWRWKRAKAREAIAQALKLDPTNPAYLVEAGSLNRRKYLWNKDNSLEYFKKALELTPADAGVLSELANHYYFRKNDKATAATYAADALKFDPQNSMALIVMGHILYRQRKYNDAREHAILVLSQNPRNYDALVLICLLESRKNILIGGSYRLGLWLRKPIPAVLFYTTCILTRTGIILILYTTFARIAFRRRIQKYVADIKLKKNF